MLSASRPRAQSRGFQFDRNEIKRSEVPQKGQTVVGSSVNSDSRNATPSRVSLSAKGTFHGESGRASDVEREYHGPPALRSLARVDESVVVGDAVVVRALVFDRQRLAIR
jgi:hypothetical protein